MCGAGVDNQNYIFLGVGHVVSEKLKIEVDSCLRNSIADFSQISK